MKSFDYIQFSNGTGSIQCRNCNKIMEDVRLNNNLSYEGNVIFCTEDCLQEYVNEQIREQDERNDAYREEDK